MNEIKKQESSKDRKRLKGKMRVDHSRRMKKAGFKAIPGNTWVDKKTLDYIEQQSAILGAENIGEGLDMLIAIIGRSKKIRGDISDRRQEAKIVTRNIIDEKRVLSSSYQNRLLQMKEDER